MRVSDAAKARRPSAADKASFTRRDARKREQVT